MPIPRIILVLAAAILIAAPFAFLLGRRGGRFRGLRGWIGFWVAFAALLIVLGRTDRAIAFPLLGLLMFAGLKQYFFLTPVRAQDRYALVASYVAIPFALWPAWLGASIEFDRLVPVALFLLLPVFLCGSVRPAGFLDSLGRVVVGVLVYVFCAAHLGLLSHERRGVLELFGILTLAAELPQRLFGRLRPGGERLRPAIGIGASATLASALGSWVGPLAGIGAREGVYLGLAVSMASGVGSLVADAVARDLELATPTTVLGRAAFLDRTMPALYAAPVYFLALGLAR